MRRDAGGDDGEWEDDSGNNAIPDYFPYVHVAEKFGCPPWELFPGWVSQPPKDWWVAAAMVVMRCENRAQQIMSERAERNAKTA